MMLALSLAAGCQTPRAPSLDDSALAPPPGFARFSGTLRDESGRGVSGAAVFAPFAPARSWGGSTDANGRFSFVAQVSDYAGLRWVALIVFRDGYLPRTLYLTGVRDGARLSISVEPLAPQPAARAPCGSIDGKNGTPSGTKRRRAPGATPRVVYGSFVPMRS